MVVVLYNYRGFVWEHWRIFGARFGYNGMHQTLEHQADCGYIPVPQLSTTLV